MSNIQTCWNSSQEFYRRSLRQLCQSYSNHKGTKNATDYTRVLFRDTVCRSRPMCPSLKISNRFWSHHKAPMQVQTRESAHILMVAVLPASIANLSALTHENSGPHTKGGSLTPHLHPQSSSEPRGDRRQQVTQTNKKFGIYETKRSAWTHTFGEIIIQTTFFHCLVWFLQGNPIWFT